MTSMNEKGISFQDVSFQYTKTRKELQSINTTISKGAFCGITGTNGSGKTTFTYLCNGLIPHAIDGTFSGNVYIDGENTRKKSLSFFSKKVGMVFQNPDFMIFNLTVREEIAFGMRNIGLTDIEKRTQRALYDVSLEGFEERDPHALSFGQKQKLCLACVLAMDTEYIVLDEPTSMLDYKNSLLLFSILSRLHKKGKTIIVVEHDTDFLLKNATQLLVLDKGTLVMEGKPKTLFSKHKKLTELGIKIPHISNI